MRARAGAILMIFLVAGLVLASIALAQGKPVRPGNATADGFMPSSGCGCHSNRVAEWSASMHSKSITDPVFLVKVAQAEAEAGTEVALFCKRCHSPVGHMLGDPTGITNATAAEGVTCMYCHQVVGIDGKPVNTAHLVEANLTRRGQIKDPVSPHLAVYSDLHTKAEICGACHDVSHPLNGTHLETSYLEWAAGPYAREGVVCQDCHMSAAAGIIGPSSGIACGGGRQRDNIFAMTFVGANVGQGPAEASRAMLRKAATVDVSVPSIVPAGTATSVTVTVNNVGAGHYLPTGLTEERQMWISVHAQSADGDAVTLGERRFGTILKDAQGKYPVEMWEASGIQSDDRVPPRGSLSSEFAFAMPADAKRATVVAVLSYRSLPEDLAAKAGVSNPVTEMARRSTVVYASQAEKDAATKFVVFPENRGITGNLRLLFVLGAAVIAAVGVGIAMALRSRQA